MDTIVSYKQEHETKLPIAEDPKKAAFLLVLVNLYIPNLSRPSMALILTNIIMRQCLWLWPQLLNAIPTCREKGSIENPTRKIPAP